jgi:hypothetical protein
LFVDAGLSTLAVFSQLFGNIQSLLLLVWTLGVSDRFHVISLCIDTAEEASNVGPFLLIDVTWIAGEALLNALICTNTTQFMRDLPPDDSDENN